MLPRDRAVRFTPGVPGTTCRRRRTPLNNEKLTFAAKKAEELLLRAHAKGVRRISMLFLLVHVALKSRSVEFHYPRSVYVASRSFK